ncbi:hypothetical protein SEA_MADAMATO_6 [Streptomyces phage Madamato]|nr:hypothetical protein SEA_MADAMATO_6 [Streptomyces phage Madamato]
MEQSILNSMKKLIGLGETDASFDLDLTIHLNSMISVLTQVGIGPAEGFMIEDSTATWESFIGSDPRQSMVKSYLYLRVRLLFDPPGTSFALDAMNKNAAELEWRLNVQREEELWTDPDPEPLPAA